VTPLLTVNVELVIVEGFIVVLNNAVITVFVGTLFAFSIGLIDVTKGMALFEAGAGDDDVVGTEATFAVPSRHPDNNIQKITGTKRALILLFILIFQNMN
jgi:hypothetical protein